MVRAMRAIEARLYTDPACPRSWALEPALRRLEVEFGAGVAIRPVMGGLARDFDGDVIGRVGAWLEAGAASGMPVDPRIWLAAPPASSYPASIAVKAAGEQGRDAALLRRVREGLMVERRRLDSAPALLEVAREVQGLDLGRFEVDLGSHAILELFSDDLERAAAVDAAHHDPARGRVRLPAIEFAAADGAVHGVYDGLDAETLRSAALAAGAQPSGDPAPAPIEALERFGRLATAEVAAACDLPGPRAPAELWRLALEWRVRPCPVLGGELWTLA